MFKYVTVVLGIAVSGAACGVSSIIEGDQVVFTAESPANVEITATCLYLALEKIHGARTAKVDLPIEKRAYVDINGDGVRFYRFAISSQSKIRTKVEGISLSLSAPGRGLNDDKIYSPIRHCLI